MIRGITQLLLRVEACAVEATRLEASPLYVEKYSGACRVLGSSIGSPAQCSAVVHHMLPLKCGLRHQGQGSLLTSADGSRPCVEISCPAKAGQYGHCFQTNWRVRDGG